MKLSTAAVIVLIAVPMALWAQSQVALGQFPDDDIVRVSTNLVSVPVIVKTRQGSYVPSLHKEDFRIYEDGVEQEISHFETIDKPFTIVLMLDMSDSTRIKLNEIENAAIAFLNQLRPDDRALIVAFDKQVVRLTEATGDRKVLSEAIRRVKTGGGTALYDTVDIVINSYLRQIPGRKAIVILTDGIDTSSVRSTYVSTVISATKQYALIYPIQYDTAYDAKPTSGDFSQLAPILTTPSGEPLSQAYKRGTRYLELIAHSAGGRFQYADSLRNLEHSFARIAEELRQQYSLSYYPKNQAQKNGERRIKIGVSIPNAVIHARESYAYKSDTP